MTNPSRALPSNVPAPCGGPPSDHSKLPLPPRRKVRTSRHEIPFCDPAKSFPKTPARSPRVDAVDALAEPVPPTRVWFVYLLRCANGALYTGITMDLEKRLLTHNAGRGSAYVRAHRPARLFAFHPAGSKSAASRLEHQVKSLTRLQKLALGKTWKAAAKAAIPGSIPSPGKTPLSPTVPDRDCPEVSTRPPAAC